MSDEGKFNYTFVYLKKQYSKLHFIICLNVSASIAYFIFHKIYY